MTSHNFPYALTSPPSETYLVAIVCGGRHYGEEPGDLPWLDAIHERWPISCVIHGNQTGADRIGKRWADTRKIFCLAADARWWRDGRREGPWRNGKMVELARHNYGICIAFPGNKGTWDTIRQAKDHMPILLREYHLPDSLCIGFQMNTKEYRNEKRSHLANARITHENAPNFHFPGMTRGDIP